MCHNAMGVDQSQSGAAFLDRLLCRFQNEGNATGFGCVKGCSCHLLACQRPIRFALQGQCERMSRVAVPSSRCVLSFLNTRTGSPLSPLSSGKPMWRWQAEVWLTALCENLRVRNGCIESLDDVSQHKTNCPCLPWSATMLQSLFLILPRHFQGGLWARFQLRNSRTDSKLIQRHWSTQLDLRICLCALESYQTGILGLSRYLVLVSWSKCSLLQSHGFESSCKIAGAINLEKHGDLHMWCHPSCSYRERYTAEAMVHCRKGWNCCARLSIESTDYHLCPFLLAGSEVLHMPPSLVLSFQHVLSKCSCWQTIRL